MDKIITIDNKKLTLTNLDKKLFPSYSKLDLIQYYDSMSEYILPYLKDRPISMKRFPDGIDGEYFFQKNIGEIKLPWLKTKKIRDHDLPRSKAGGKTTEYLICNDKATLIFLANLAAIEIHPWLSRTQHLDKPDFLLLDLDPEDIGFNKVVEVALAAKKILDRLDINSYIKASGIRGLHILISLGAQYSYEQSRTFGEILAHLIHNEIPEITSLDRLPEKRQKKVYIDYLQNSEGQTMIAPYSVRATAEATVSAPLEWKELDSRLNPKNFSITNIKSRVKKLGNLFKELHDEKAVNIQKLLNLL